MIFTADELEYLKSQRLGRLATIQPNGSIQNNPVVYWYNAEADCIDIGGRAMATTQKFKNVAANGKASFVIDDVVSRRPWRVRGIEIRGHAEALIDQPVPPELEFLSPELIRIRPQRLFTWGLDPEQLAMVRRNVTPAGATH
ncbi:PPOX class F420-dependent oxidoreductase [Micromonospora sp. LAH09]|uniref:PPOX class F420-dependent oxidoreductase n=1 Tax=Micromonospora cabrerizensis TaxID=2911213 RepID=UPI001EE9406D|nr:PPOX class F420-dependent oxidoreductase [Micromonospora cabrerizensis]MCG5468331.1 PPOX class F420-dependent oxidoreductase [Micromonospora cabrerizensis]